MSAGAVACNYLKDGRDGESIVPGAEPPLLHHRLLGVVYSGLGNRNEA